MITEKGTERRPYLANLAVSPKWKRKGVGRQLVQSVENAVQELSKNVRRLCHFGRGVPRMIAPLWHRLAVDFSLQNRSTPS